MTVTTINPPTPSHPPGAPWSLASAAEFLGISKRTLHKLIERERVKAIRIARRVLIADAEVQRISNEGA